MKLYRELARWWPLFSPPSHYTEEAADLLPTLLAAPDRPPRTLLELGSGGGSLASHFAHALELTLTDRSEEMLAISRTVNPSSEHLAGDMRSLRIDRQFDVVFVHDAIMYATDEEAVRSTLATAAHHCRSGGAVVVVPDFVRETFEADSDCGGEDGPDGRGLRYVSWTYDPNPSDTTYDVDYAFIFRDQGVVTVDSDRHREGLFPRAAWLEWLRAERLEPSSRIDPWNRDVFSARKRRG